MPAPQTDKAEPAFMRCISVAVAGDVEADVEAVARDIEAKMKDSMASYPLPKGVQFEDVSVIDPDEPVDEEPADEHNPQNYG